MRGDNGFHPARGTMGAMGLLGSTERKHMEDVAKGWLQSLVPGESQVWKNLVVCPLLAVREGTVPYLTLAEAMAGRRLSGPERGPQE